MAAAIYTDAVGTSVCISAIFTDAVEISASISTIYTDKLIVECGSLLQQSIICGARRSRAPVMCLCAAIVCA